MKRFKTKQIALCVAAALAATSAVPAAFAASFSDTAGHWAENAINVWSDRGVIQGFDGQFNPNDFVTRAEAASILSGAIGYADETGDTFTDVEEDAWYAKVVKKASAAKAINGDGTGLFRPKDNITREEAAVIFTNAFGITANADVSAFSDAADIAEWAKGAVGGMSAAGYISGDNGAYYPKRSLTRAEMVTMLNNMVKTYIDQAGTYTQNNTYGGIILIKAGGVTLSTVKADGIVISPEVGSGIVVIQNVTTAREIKNLAPDAKVQSTGTNVTIPGGPTSGVSGGSGGGGGGNGGSSEKNSNLSVKKVQADTNLSGMTPEDLMENIEITSSSNNVIRVKGTLKYVTGYTGYSDEPKNQNGYYIAIQVVPGSSRTSKMQLTITAPNEEKHYGREDLEDGAVTILRKVDSKLLSNGFTCSIDLDGTGTNYRNTNYTINLSGLVMEPSIQLVPVDDGTKLLGEEKASDLMSGVQITRKTKSSNEFNATGDLKYYKGYTAFSDEKKEQSGNYLAVRMVPKLVTDDTVVTIIGSKKSKKTFSKKDNPEVFEEDGSLITIWRVTEDLQESNIVYQVDYDGAGTVYSMETYVLDIVDLELLEEEKAPPLAFAAAPDDMTLTEQGMTQAELVREFKLTTDKEKKKYYAKGALRYAENTGFAPDTERDSGHFVILAVTPDPEQWKALKSKILVIFPGNGDAEWASAAYFHEDLTDGTLYLPVRAEDITEGGIEFIVYFNGDDTTNPDYYPMYFNGVELLDKAAMTVTAAPADQQAWNKTQADFVEDFDVTDVDVMDGYDLRASGSLKFAEATGYWPDDERDNGHFVILEITPADWNAEKGVITREYVGRDEDWAVRSYGNEILENGKLYLCVRAEDILEDGLKITVDPDGDGEALAVSYVIDFTDVKMLRKPAFTLDAAAEQGDYVESLAVAKAEADTGFDFALEGSAKYRANGAVVLNLTPASEWTEAGTVVLDYVSDEAIGPAAFGNDDLNAGKLALEIPFENIQKASALKITIDFDGEGEAEAQSFVIGLTGLEILQEPAFTLDAAAEQGEYVESLAVTKAEADSDFDFVLDGNAKYQEGGAVVLELKPSAEWTEAGTVVLDYVSDEAIESVTFGNDDLNAGILALNIPLENIQKASALKITIDFDGEGEAAAQSFLVQIGSIREQIENSKPSAGGAGGSTPAVSLEDVTE